MLVLLRVLLYVQLFLGIGRFAGLVRSERLWETHVGVGIVIVVLALSGLRSRPGATASAMRSLARFVPLLPLVTGLAILGESVGGRGFTVFHMLLGVTTVGIVEMVAARGKRAPPRGS